MKSILYTFLALSFSGPAFADRIVHAPTGREIPDLATAIEGANIVVVGEYHYEQGIVVVQAAVLRELAAKGQTTLGWEFLNTVDRARVSSIVSDLHMGKVDASEALTQLFAGANANLEYTALIEAVGETGVDLVPTNLTREQKTPVSRGGIENVDPELLPPDFALGTENYATLFAEAMGSHSLSASLQNYYEAQCLTDDVMAYELLSHKSEYHMLVTGAFHGDFGEGAVHRLRQRAPESKVTYIKVVTTELFSAEEIEEMLLAGRFGPVADILYIVE